MKNNILFYYLLFFSMFIGLSQRSLDTIKFKHMEKKLSENSPTVIFEDSKNALWVGTIYGLNKFDGENVKMFNDDLNSNSGPKVKDNYILTIYEDQDSLIYFGTSNGLRIFDYQQDKIKKYPFKGQGTALNSIAIKRLLRKGDFLYLADYYRGLYKYNINTGETKTIYLDKKCEVPSCVGYLVDFYPTDQGFLVVTKKSIALLDDDINIISKDRSFGHKSSSVRIAEDQYILGTYKGELLRLKVDGSNFKLENEITISPNHTILDLEKDSSNNIWIGTENDGLAIYSLGNGSVRRLKKNKFKSGSIKSNSIWTLYKGRDDFMWVGSYRNGLSYYDPNQYRFGHVEPLQQENTLNNGLVNCFLENTSDQVFVGTDGGGLNVWDLEKDVFKTYSKDKGNFFTNVVLGLEKVSNGTIWAGSWNDGIAVINPDDFTYRILNKDNSFLDSNHIFDILEDREGRIWIAALWDGLYVYDPANGKHEKILLQCRETKKNSASMRSIFEDNNGQIWVGTESEGAFKISSSSQGWQVTNYHPSFEKKRINNYYVNTIRQGADGKIWAGTETGLNLYDPEKDSFNEVKLGDFQGNPAIRSMAIDDSSKLWLGTLNGILRYNASTQKVDHFNTLDGLQGEEFIGNSVLKSEDGTLMFGGINGYNIFDPEQIILQGGTPEIYVSSLKIFNQTVEPNDPFDIIDRHISQVDTLTFSPEHSVINLSFFAKTLRNQDKIEYAYHLEGFDKKWNHIGKNNNITYTNLSPGTYTLTLKSTNSDGKWVFNHKSIVIDILPPFWKTIWFYLFIAVVAAGIVYLIVNYRIKRAKMLRSKLEFKINERTKELTDKKEELYQKSKETQRFAYAVSHDLKTPLSNIKGIANLIKMDLETMPKPEIHQYAEYINQTCDSMNNLILEISGVAKVGSIRSSMEDIDLNALVQDASKLLKHKIIAHNITLEIDNDLPVICGDRNRMLQVFENLIDNSIQSMGEQKEPVIIIRGSAKTQHHSIHIIDNGTGICSAKAEELFSLFENVKDSINGSGLGLYITKEIIQSHGGRIEAVPKDVGKGTELVLSFPKVVAPVKSIL